MDKKDDPGPINRGAKRRERKRREEGVGLLPPRGSLARGPQWRREQNLDGCEQDGNRFPRDSFSVPGQLYSRVRRNI